MCARPWEMDGGQRRLSCSNDSAAMIERRRAPGDGDTGVCEGGCETGALDRGRADYSICGLSTALSGMLRVSIHTR